MTDVKLGPRLKALREGAGLSQDQMAGLLRVGSHQIVSQIESGDRRLKAEELLVIVEAFNVPLDVLTNPFLIMGEGHFSWRQSNVPPKDLAAYEHRAGEWIGAYRALRQANCEPFPLLQKRLGLDKSSTFEDAAGAAEGLVNELDLGDVPAARLASVMQERLGILVLMVDAVPGVSGAACQIPELGVVLINRNEPRGRRSFDLAHELFHILTWTTMPPEHLDGQTNKNRKVEQLADNFASALLAPSRTLDQLPAIGENYAQWLNASATHLHMSAQALKWRMINSGRVAKADGLDVPDDDLRNNGEPAAEASPPPPPLFSQSFVATLATAIDRGNISVRRAAALVGLDPQDLGELCDTHGVPRPEDL